MVRRRATASTHDVDEAARRELPQQRPRLIRQLVVLAERVGQPGVRVTADVAVGHAGQIHKIRPHVACPERAIDPDTQRPGVGNGHVERVDGLPRQRASAAVGNRHRDHQRQLEAPLVEQVPYRDQRRLRVERVEYRLDQQQVAPAIHQTPRLFEIGVPQRVERGGAKRRVVHVRRDRQRPIRRPDCAGHEPRAVRGAFGPHVDGGPGKAGGLDVQLIYNRLERVVRLSNGGAAERVGLDDVAARLQIRVMDPADHVRPGQHEQVVVPLQVARMAGEALAAKRRLVERVTLNHRAHGAVHHEDAFAE